MVDSFMKTYFISILLLLQFGLSQIIPQAEPYSPESTFSIGSNFLNSDKLKIQQGFSVGTSFLGNQSMSYGMFSNNFQYDIKSNLQMSGGVHFLQKTGNNPLPYQNNNFDVLYDLNLKFQPWENTWIQLSVSNLGPQRYKNNIFTK
mgnify:CR=1 FL=1